MTDDLPVTPAEKRAAAARARLEAVGHPLFPTEPGEKAVPIAFIQIRRYTEQGPVDHQRIWPAAEITGQDDIFQMFGGGAYELWGRAALANGLPGGIVKRIRLTLDGLPRPFTVASQATALAAVHGGGAAVAQPADRYEMFLHMMREDRREARDRMERQEADARAADERRIARDEQRSSQMTQIIATGLQAVVGIVTAVLSRPAPPPQEDRLMPLLAQLIPKPEKVDELAQLHKVMEIAEKLHPKKGGTESLSDLVAGFGQAMSGVAQLEHARIEAAEKGLVPVHIAMAQQPGQAPTDAQQPQQAPAQPSPAPGLNGNVPPLNSPPPQYLEPADDEAARLRS
jgi:hypothetical protein